MTFFIVRVIRKSNDKSYCALSVSCERGITFKQISGKKILFGLQPQSVLSRHWAEFFSIRTSKSVNNIYIFLNFSLSELPKQYGRNLDKLDIISILFFWPRDL